MPAKQKNEARNRKEEGRRKSEKKKVKTAVSLLIPKTTAAAPAWFCVKPRAPEDSYMPFSIQ